MVKSWLAFLLIFALGFGVGVIFQTYKANSPAAFEGYRVTEYDAAAGLWTIVRSSVVGGQRQIKRLTVGCQFSSRTEDEPVRGNEACKLQIGQILPSTETWVNRGRKGAYVYEEPGYISVIQGDETRDRVVQGFRILKDELLSSASDE